MYPNQDAIFERLETTKKFGLLSDYLVSWVGRAGRLNPKVTVWGRDGTPEDVVEHYNKGGIKNQWLDQRLKPLNLTDQDKKDLVAFLKALSGEGWQDKTAPKEFPK